MIAAIYARKSTEQNGVAEDAKSVTRQIEHAKAYAATKGWHVVEAHIYTDDGISGAEFVNRPGFLRLMNSIKPKPPFQVLIMSEESRLGREQIKTAYALQQLVDAGVHVWFYLTDEERKLNSAMDKIMGSLAGFASELERERAQQRTYDAMLRKAKAGYVTGGRVFGYDNVEIVGTEGIRSHVELRINETEAAIIRQIFELYAKGHGFTSIAKRLNAEGARAPRPRPEASKPHGWVSSSVRTILLRRLYVGEQVWGRTTKRMASRLKRQRRPDHDWLIVKVPQAQIVSRELWQETQSRWQQVRQLYLRSTDGTLHGRPPNGHESPYLLTGFIECKLCKGSLTVRSRSHGKRRAFHYACTTHYNRGPEACAESMLIPMDLLDRDFLSTVEQSVLDPAIIALALEKAIHQLKNPTVDPDARRDALQNELTQIEHELARLTTAIASGGPLTTLLAAVQEREARRSYLLAELATIGTNLSGVDAMAIEDELRRYLADWPRLASRHPVQTRQLLRKLFARRIRVWREEELYCYAGEAAVGRFFSGFLGVKCLGVPNGI